MIFLYIYQQQPHTNDIKTRPVEGQVYEFDYGPNGKKQHYKTGDKVFPEQDAIIMAIPKEETNSFDKEGRQYVWFQCRICGKLAYGTIHQAKNKNSQRYNPCGCHKKQASSETGKKTGPQNCQHFIEWAKSPEGRASSSRIGKTIGCKNIIYAQEYCKQHPEHYSAIGKKNIKYALKSLKKWQQEHPEMVAEYQRRATEAANKWREENPEQWKELCRKKNKKLRNAAIPSKGEQLLINYMSKHNIKYQREVEMQGVLGPKGYPRRLDFIITYHNISFAVEVQGAQHYDENHIFNTSDARYDPFTVQEIDKIKQKYCDDLNIPLYKIDARKLQTVISQFEDIINLIEKGE